MYIIGVQLCLKKKKKKKYARFYFIFDLKIVLIPFILFCYLEDFYSCKCLNRILLCVYFISIRKIIIICCLIASGIIVFYFCNYLSFIILALYFIIFIIFVTDLTILHVKNLCTLFSEIPLLFFLSFKCKVKFTICAVLCYFI